MSPQSELRRSSLHSHHPRLSPPISPGSYLSVITDLKTAQTLSVMAQHADPQDVRLPSLALQKKNHFLL